LRPRSMSPVGGGAGTAIGRWTIHVGYSQFWPIVRAACEHHWRDLATSFGKGDRAPSDSSLHQSVELAFMRFGEDLLTPRERQVVEFTLKGHSADAVGKILEISPGTVRIHRRNVYSKLRIRSQGELFSRFIETLVTDPSGGKPSVSS
jgi:DNA-binding CsgD family transcriptional regulator